MSFITKIAAVLVLPLMVISLPASQAADRSSSPFKHEVGPSSCKPGVIKGPKNKFGVFVFCDDAMGTTIGLISLGQGGPFPQMEDNWPLDKRFWQESYWARDVKYFEWAPDGHTLTVRTNYIYGTNKLYTLDLVNKEIISAVVQPLED